jgi:CBS domain-containing protein
MGAVGGQKIVADYMTKTVYSMTLGHTVAQVIKLFNDKNITGAPVVGSDGRLIGIVSILDMIIAASIGQIDVKLSELPAQIKATKPVITLHPDSLLKEAIILVANKRIGRIIIVNEENKPVGMITRKDLLRYYARQVDNM